MSGMVVRVGGVVVQQPKEEIKVESRWSGDLEDSRKQIIDRVVHWVFPVALMTKLTLSASKHAYAASTMVAGADGIRKGFTQLLDVFTAISEPILWFYALTACILMATKNKQAGLDRLKQVAYAYGAIALLPTFFAFVRFIANIIKHSVNF